MSLEEGHSTNAYSFSLGINFFFLNQVRESCQDFKSVSFFSFFLSELEEYYIFTKAEYRLTTNKVKIVFLYPLTVWN